MLLALPSTTGCLPRAPLDPHSEHHVLAVLGCRLRISKDVSWFLNCLGTGTSMCKMHQCSRFALRDSGTSLEHRLGRKGLPDFLLNFGRSLDQRWLFSNLQCSGFELRKSRSIHKPIEPENRAREADQRHAEIPASTDQMHKGPRQRCSVLFGLAWCLSQVCLVAKPGIWISSDG